MLYMFDTIKLENSQRKEEKKTKKILVFVMSLSFVLMLGLSNVFGADTYSDTQVMKNISLASGYYKLNGKATYHISGATRWSFSSEYLLFQSGTGPKGYGIKSKSTSDGKKSGNVQRIRRNYKYYATNNNYSTQEGKAYFTWYFNTSSKKFVSGF